MRMTYGIDILPKDDPWVQLGIEIVRIGSVSALYGTYLVDWIPVCKSMTLLQCSLILPQCSTYPHGYLARSSSVTRSGGATHRSGSTLR